MKRKFSRFRLNPYTTHAIFGISVGTAVGIAGSVASAAGSLAGGSAGSEAAGAAAGLQKEYIDLGINELRGALGPSMARLDKEQAWSDAALKRERKLGMVRTQPYAQAGINGLARLNFLMGQGNPLPPPTAPKAPTAPVRPAALKPPKYDKDPAKAAAQRTQYENAVAAQNAQFAAAKKKHGEAKVKYQKDLATYTTNSAAYKAQSEAQASDPEFGSLLNEYDDRFEDQITDVSQRQFADKYAGEILDVGRDKFDATDFEADPGYEFRRSEGNRGVEQSAAAGGSLQSGATLKALTRFNQDTASNEFDRAHGRWADQRNTRLGTLKGQQGFDYNVFGAQKGTELDTLANQRNFDFGNWQGNRDFQYNALMGQVGVGQDAVDDRNALAQHYTGQRTQNRLNTAQTQGNWRQNTAATIAEFLAQSGNAQAAGVVGAANAQTNAFQGVGNALGTGLGYFGGGNNNNYQPGGRTPSGGRYAPQWYLDSHGLSQ